MSCLGNTFDASTYGMLIEVPQYIPGGTKITIQIHGCDDCVEATVRYCRKHGAWYRIGLQLPTLLALNLSE